jgi:deazaflavin-dependent oxidoreductase (nitroreductase family)
MPEEATAMSDGNARDTRTDEQARGARLDELAHNSRVIEEFRANGGRVGGRYEGSPLLLLHTTGARTGRALTSPLTYQTVGDGFAVFASYRGSRTHPYWFLNLRAHPDAAAEIGTAKVEVRARVLEGERRDLIWQEQVRRHPHFAEYQALAGRTIPVVLLERR